MSVTIFHITKNEGHNYTGQSREIMAEQFGGLPEGRYKVTVEEDKPGGYTATRYRFYFGVVLAAILEACRDMFQIIDHATGERKPLRNTTDLHEALKMMYNPISVITPHGAFTTGGTTTSLNDREFIGQFMEQIQADFSQAPYNVNFVDADEWRAAMKAKRDQR